MPNAGQCLYCKSLNYCPLEIVGNCESFQRATAQFKGCKMKFNNYIVIGDYVEYTPENNNPRGFVIRATICEDYDSSPDDSEGYTEEQIKQWKNDDWFYCGVILSVYKAGVCLSTNAASLWGVECNFPNASNSYLSDIVKELETEALQEAGIILQKLND